MKWPDLHGLRVSLVYPPYGVTYNEPGIRAVKENYGVFPSLSLLYVAGVLEACKVEVQFIDANAMCLDKRETLDRLETFRPHLVGYTLTTYLFHQNLEWIRDIREALGVPSLVGGVHLGLFPHESFSHGCLDLGVTGEAEMSLPGLLEAFMAGEEPADVPGVVFRRGDEVVVTPPAGLVQDVDDVPLPARHLIDNSLYYSFISRKRNFTPLMTSRGCPFRCIFCEQGGVRFRPRSPEVVVDEIEHAMREHGVREFDFFDSAFTINKPRVHAICEEIQRRGLEFVWAARSRVDSVDVPMLRAMKAAGCDRIYYGLESGNREILRTLRKAADLDQMVETVAMTREIGIETFGYFMIGSPGETEATMRQTVQLSLRLDLDYAQFSKVTPMPGTELYGMLVEETGRDLWREIVLDPAKDSYMPRPRCELGEQQIQEMTRLAYLRFYFRPSYIARALKRLRSFDELRRSVRTAAQMVLSPPEGDDSGPQET
jgi:anaerobic magnesium-protoporphyrin IX monomethyl ester cyclase